MTEKANIAGAGLGCSLLWLVLTVALFVVIPEVALFRTGVLGIGVANAADATTAVSDKPAGVSGRDVLKGVFDGVVDFTLSNGLRVVMFRRQQAPVFSAELWVKVGGVDEVPGITGVSHLLEHMAFKGSKTIGTSDYAKEKPLLAKYDQLVAELDNSNITAEQRQEIGNKISAIEQELEKIWVNNEFSLLYQQRGAVGLNAATGKDYTTYMVSLPSESFEMWCWMESDRLLNPVFRQFYKELQVVIEERRSRTDDSPNGRLYEALLAAAFWMHPNRLPVIGWATDLQKLKVKDIEKLYGAYYRPDNMVLGIVGDLDPEQAKPMLERYFGRLPRGEGPIPKVNTVEAPQNGERKATVYYDAEPRFAMAYHKPVYPHPDDMQFMVLHSLLNDGRSSIFHKELIQQKQLATSVSSSEAPGERYPSLFYVWGVPRQGVSVDRLLGEVQAILDRLKVEKVSDADLKAAKKRIQVQYLNNLTSNSELAGSLAHAWLLWGDWRVLSEMYDAALNTTAEDIQRLAKTYFHVENRTVVRLEKDARLEKKTK